MPECVTPECRKAALRNAGFRHAYYYIEYFREYFIEYLQGHEEEMGREQEEGENRRAGTALNRHRVVDAAQYHSNSQAFAQACTNCMESRF
jgi:hypothetical protein